MFAALARKIKALKSALKYNQMYLYETDAQ